jgi:hypothetical protein
MGTRADFYVGRGEDAEWLGSIAWDGYPDGIAHEVKAATNEQAFRHYLARFFSSRDDVTTPGMGWPWPWATSHTTDFAYAYEAQPGAQGDAGHVYASCFGGDWQAALSYVDREDDGPAPVFPDMSARSNVQLGGKRSGLIVVSARRSQEMDVDDVPSADEL